MTKREKLALWWLKVQMEYYVNRATKPLGVKAYLSDSFFAESKNNKIAFAMLVGEESNNLFMDNWAECHPEIIDTKLSSFSLSLWHEVGHCCDPYDEPAEESDVRDECDELGINGNVEQANKKYFSLPSEQKATAWANTFVHYHQKECLKLDKICTKLISKFLQKHLTD